MGYCRDSAGRLVCDRCGNAGGVRRRTCPHKVLTDSVAHARMTLPNCSPWALCATCFRVMGGNKGVHEGCAAEAAAAQARYDAIEAGLDAGELFVLSATSGERQGVPDGQVGVIFHGRGGHVHVLVPAADYDSSARPRLSDYPTTVPWPQREAA
jgi:hypothetical protein